MDNNSNSHPPKKDPKADDLLKMLKAKQAENPVITNEPPKIEQPIEKPAEVKSAPKTEEKDINEIKEALKAAQNIPTAKKEVKEIIETTDAEIPTREIPIVEPKKKKEDIKTDKDNLDVDAMVKRFAPETLEEGYFERAEPPKPDPEPDITEEVVEQDRYTRFAPKKKPAENKNPDIEKRIKAAEIYATNMTEKVPAAEIPDTSEETKKNEIDDVDVNLMIAFEMDDELAQTVGIEKVNEIESDISKNFEHITNKTIQTGVMQKESFEYTDTSQTKEILQNYKKVYHNILIRFGACFLLVLLTFLYENIGLFGGTLPSPVHPDLYPVIHILINLQFLVLASALIYKSLYNGITALFKFQPIPESVTFVILAVTFAYHILLCFINIGSGVRLFNLPVVICIFMTIMYEFMNLKRELYGFNIVASKRMKHAVVQINPNKAELESETFYEFLPQNPLMLKIKKTPFIDGFYKRMAAYPKNKKILNFVITAILLITVAFFVFAYMYKPENELFVSVQIAYMTLIICTPLSLFITYSYPFYKASKEAYENDSAIIGEISLEEYSRASAISFDDLEVFPSDKVNIKSVKVYGNNAVDQVIFRAASLFNILGGPLAHVFEVATAGLGTSEKVDLIEVADDGIEAMVDNVHIFVGKSSYLLRNEFTPLNPEEDKKIETGGEVSVMYMVCEKEVVAKMYMQYIMDTDFESIIHQLYKSGMCIGIKTFDPNINESMLSARIRLNKYPVKIIRCRSLEDQIETEKHIESGIISKNLPKSLLQTLTLCDKVLQIIKMNIFVKIVVMVISVVIMAALLLLEMSDAVNSFYITLYQLFWSIPMVIIARLLI